MDTLQLKKVTAPLASQITAQYLKKNASQPRPDSKQCPADYVSALIAEELYAEATQFMVYALPKREAIWLACMVYQAGNPPPQPDAVRLAEAWVYEPNENNRQAALIAAADIGYDNAEGLIAASAGWSSTSLMPGGNEPVAPADDLSAKTAWAAIMLQAYARQPEHAAMQFKAILQQAIDIANGGAGRANGDIEQMRNK